MAWEVCKEAGKNIQDETGNTFLCYNEDEAEKLVEYLNERESRKTEKRVLTIPYDEQLDLHSDFLEWNELNDWLLKTGKRLIEIEEIYDEEFKIELANALETGVDFKKIYGGNTDKTRKRYVDEQLSDLIDEKKLLKSLQADDLRRIEFLKKLISMKLKLIDKTKEIHL